MKTILNVVKKLWHQLKGGQTRNQRKVKITQKYDIHVCAMFNFSEGPSVFLDLMQNYVNYCAVFGDGYRQKIGAKHILLQDSLLDMFYENDLQKTGIIELPEDLIIGRYVDYEN